MREGNIRIRIRRRIRIKGSIAVKFVYLAELIFAWARRLTILHSNSFTYSPKKQQN